MAAGAYWFAHTGGSDAFVQSIAAILETFFVVPRRDYLIVATAGAFFALLSYALPLIDRFVVARLAALTSGSQDMEAGNGRASRLVGGQPDGPLGGSDAALRPGSRDNPD
jgi:hypothetical protein